MLLSRARVTPFAPQRPSIDRAEAIRRITAIVGSANLVRLYVAAVGEGATPTESSSAGATITWANHADSQLVGLGNGWFRRLNGTTQYGSMPDAADLSFGDGAADSPFSTFCLVNQTPGTGDYRLLDKGNNEYLLTVEANRLRAYLEDESAGALCFRTGVALPAYGGNWTLHGTSYDASESANGISLSRNALPVSSSATDDSGGTYVAMEALTGELTIGAIVGGAGQFWPGDIAIVGLASVELAGGQFAQIAQVCRDLFGVPL